jgi:hypothetical protein
MVDVKMKILEPGDRVSEQLLRPDKVQTFGMIDPIAGEAIGIMMTPYADDAEFTKPVTLVIPVEKIDAYIDLIRTAQQRLPKAEGGVV